MSFANDDMVRTIEPGFLAPADGNYSAGIAPASLPAGFAAAAANASSQRDVAATGAAESPVLGPNNERLEDMKPELVHALRELVRQYRQEGIVARRHEIRRIRQARLFWQELQYAWWNPNDMNWHLPFEQRFSDDRALEEMPRYQFVTNFYQGFGLSFIAVLSQDVPSEMTDQERANIDALNQQFLGQQQQIGNTLLPQYQSILNNPGLSPADKAAATGQSQGALASAFDSLQQSAQNRLARTRNSVGFGELTDELARQKGIAQGGQAQQNQRPSPTPPFNAKWPRCKGSPASSASTRTSWAARSASPLNFSTSATTPRAAMAAASSPRSAPASAPRWAPCPVRFSDGLRRVGIDGQAAVDTLRGEDAWEVFP